MKHVFVILIFFSGFLIHAQNPLKYTTNVVSVDDVDAPGFYLSDRPITNREYLTYLLWTINTYENYPFTVIEALPGLQEKEVTGFFDGFIFSENPFMFYSERAPDVVKNYLFNPRYIDYPVVGLTWQQAMNFCKWLADRYNEFVLIKKGYLEFSMDQIDSECFVTESFLYRQYEGYAKKENTIRWCDGVLIPAFRLPIQSEIENGNEENGISTDIRPYIPGVNPFLKKWSDLYIELNDTALLLYDRFYNQETPSFFLKTEKEYDLQTITGDELTLDDRDQYNYDYKYVLISKGYHFRAPDHYRDIEFFFTEKDSLGQMPFIIIDEYDSGTPMAIEHYKFYKSIEPEPFKTNISRYALIKR
jgi:hypothetical protein